MRFLLIAAWLLFGAVTSAMSQVSVSIGINVPVYPALVRVPGYPVYYAPRLPVNYFFYDGMYWVYEADTWYVSYWYNGPWRIVAPVAVPLFVLRIPVRYYRDPPVYFRSWRRDAPPRWNEHWGREWEERRSGWDHWNRRAAPPPAPLPAYQRQYSGDRYPREEQQQQALRGQHYRYRPRDSAVRQHAPEQAMPAAPAPAPREHRREFRGTPEERIPPRHMEQDRRRFDRPEAPPPRAGAVEQRRREPVMAAPRQEQQPPPRSRQEERPPHGKNATQPHGRKQEQDKGRGRDQD